MVGRLRLSPMAWWKFVRLNFLRKNTITNRSRNGYIYPSSHCVFDLHPSAKIVLNGPWIVGNVLVKGSKLETRVRMAKDTMVQVDDIFVAYAGADIQLGDGGTLILEGGAGAGCNIHCQIVCAATIRLGKHILIGRNIVIRDYDAHTIDQPNYEIKAPITIGHNCWIGEGALISKGVTIGDGSIVGARSWVISNVKPHSLVAGSPAIRLKKNIRWKR